MGQRSYVAFVSTTLTVAEAQSKLTRLPELAQAGHEVISLFAELAALGRRLAALGSAFSPTSPSDGVRRLVQQSHDGQAS